MPFVSDIPERYFLYAEDDPDDQLTLTDIVTRIDPGIQVICVDQGLALMQWLNELPVGANFPCCIILDMNMPIWDGLHTLEQLKKHFSLRDIPVVMFTTSSASRDVDRCLQLGAETFLTKPLKDHDMIAVGKEFSLFCNRPAVKKLLMTTSVQIP
jgi:CheY-like chemotaxis protein